MVILIQRFIWMIFVTNKTWAKVFFTSQVQVRIYMRAHSGQLRESPRTKTLAKAANIKGQQTFIGA